MGELSPYGKIFYGKQEYQHEEEESVPETPIPPVPAIGFDHSPIILVTSPPRKRKGKSFRYEAFWVEEEDCVTLVRDTWTEPALQQLCVVEKLILYVPFATWKLKPLNTPSYSVHGQLTFGALHPCTSKFPNLD